MDYAVPHPPICHYADNAALATLTCTVSGSFGATTDASCLSALVTPSLSSVEYYSGSGASPLARFEFQVCQQWISNFDPNESAVFTSTFQSMRSTGTAYLTGYSWETLHDMWIRGMLRWGESEIQEKKIRSMQLPLDPGFDLSTPQSGPTIFVRQPHDGNKIAIMNGNHRTAKVLLEGEATDATLYVLELSSPEASFELLGVAPAGKYTNPRMPAVQGATFTAALR